MIQFKQLTEAGARAAAMSGVAEGDCSLRPQGREGRAAFLAAVGLAAERAVGVVQVHGNRVLCAREEDAGRGGLDREAALGEADGIVTNVPNLPICVSIADCVPVLLYSPKPLAGAVLHSGRESTYGNISAAGVETLVAEYGCREETIIAVLGPSICESRYEVSDEIAERFRNAGYPVSGRYLNLPAIIRQQLVEAGLSPVRIFLTDICTFDNPQFYSFRRDNAQERNMAVLCL